MQQESPAQHLTDVSVFFHPEYLLQAAGSGNWGWMGNPVLDGSQRWTTGGVRTATQL